MQEGVLLYSCKKEYVCVCPSVCVLLLKSKLKYVEVQCQYFYLAWNTNTLFNSVAINITELQDHMLKYTNKNFYYQHKVLSAIFILFDKAIEIQTRRQ